MTELDCSEIKDSIPEFALDILGSNERSQIAAHLLRCPACRAEVEAMSQVGERLLDLVPGTEPPLGFENRVLARVDLAPPPKRTLGRYVRERPRVVAAVGSAVAALAILFGSIGWVAGHSNSHQPALLLSAQFMQGGRSVGELYAYRGNPPWLSMTVHGSTIAGRVTCEVAKNDGTVTKLGSFDLGVGGSASWGAPDGAGLTGVKEVELVGAHGEMVASAMVR